MSLLYRHTASLSPAEIVAWTAGRLPDAPIRANTFTSREPWSAEVWRTLNQVFCGTGTGMWQGAGLRCLVLWGSECSHPTQVNGFQCVFNGAAKSRKRELLTLWSSVAALSPNTDKVSSDVSII